MFSKLFGNQSQERLKEIERKQKEMELRIIKIEETISTIIKALNAATSRAKGLKQKTERELIEIKAAISAQMETLEAVTRGELDQARREEVAQLLRWARHALARVNTHMKILADNDNPGGGTAVTGT